MKVILENLFKELVISRTYPIYQNTGWDFKKLHPVYNLFNYFFVLKFKFIWNTNIASFSQSQ